MIYCNGFRNDFPPQKLLPGCHHSLDKQILVTKMIQKCNKFIFKIIITSIWQKCDKNNLLAMGPWVDWHCTLPASSMERVLRVVTYNVHRFTLGGGVLSMIPSLKMLEPSVLCLNEVDTSRQNTSLDILAGALVHFLQIAQQYILSIWERT